MRKVLTLIFLGLLLCFQPAQASIFKKKPEKQSKLAYGQLICTPEDVEKIHTIITAMGEKSKLALLFQKSELRELGNQITHVHPLKFLAVIFKDPQLKSHMQIVWNDYFKRNGFMEDLAPALSREAEAGKLDIYLDAFSKDVGVPKEHVKAYFDVHDWENFVLYLIQS